MEHPHLPWFFIILSVTKVFPDLNLLCYNLSPLLLPLYTLGWRVVYSLALCSKHCVYFQTPFLEIEKSQFLASFLCQGGENVT